MKCFQHIFTWNIKLRITNSRGMINFSNSRIPRFMTLVSFYDPWKHKKTTGFFMISVGGLIASLTLFRIHHFRDAHGWEGSKKAPSLKSVTHILQWWNLTQLYLTKKRSKKYVNHVTHLMSSTGITIFSLEMSNLSYIKKYRYTLAFF